MGMKWEVTLWFD